MIQELFLTFSRRRFATAVAAMWLILPCGAQNAATGGSTNFDWRDAEVAMKQFQVAKGLKVDLWAAEPLVQNPVAFNFDEQGRAYVCETFRLGKGVDDIRGIMDWLDEELASRSVSDRLAEMKRHLADRFASYSQASERIRVIEDRDHDGRADHASVFAEDFRTPLDGLGAGVLAHKGNVWYANIPNLWLLRDTNNTGKAAFRKSLHYGFGVRVGFLGHDLHGLHFGPDGRIYFSIGDRGSNIKLADGTTVGQPETGCVFRCYPDGSELEVYAYGLRNPQDLVLDQFGNLFTGDNNSDSGDEARWVYVVEGGDSGWRVGYQFMERPYSRGPFNAEKLWYPRFPGQAAYIVPPITNIASGPSGVAYFPGTGLPASFTNRFLLVDFRGGPVNSGIHSFSVKPDGAGFTLADPQHFIWGVLATDVKFGPEGGVYLTDWIEGWGMPGKGRIYRVHAPELDRDPLVLKTKELLATPFEKHSNQDLAKLLGQPDMRVRLEAQFALAERGLDSLGTLSDVARKNPNQLARLHAMWGIGQVARPYKSMRQVAGLRAAVDTIASLLKSSDAEIRAQAAKVLGEVHDMRFAPALTALTGDSSARVRFFAAMSLGKLGDHRALPAIFEMLRANGDADPFLRHAGVMALRALAQPEELVACSKSDSTGIRMGALLALRRLHRDEVAIFLRDASPAIVLEAARAINDEPINGAMPELAALVTRTAAEPPGQAESKWETEALVRRVLNANLHVGTEKAAAGLVTFAANAEASATMRVEALKELADWEHPSGRDRVVGLWRPIAEQRSRSTAAEALKPHIPGLLSQTPDSVRSAALRAIGALQITNASPALVVIVGEATNSSNTRVEALRTLAAIHAPETPEVIARSEKDANERVRNAATELRSELGMAGATARLAELLEQGSISEKQSALGALGASADAASDQVLLAWLDKLQAGKVEKDLELDLLEAAGKRNSELVRKKLASNKKPAASDDLLADYQECLFGGDPTKGRKIFFERPEAQCVRCHKVDGVGGEVGPDLSHIAAQKDNAFLLESVLLPNKQIAQGFDSVTLVLKNGEVAAGVLKSESDTEITLNSAEAGVVKIKKADIESRRKALSPMPEGFGQLLNKMDLRDLIAFLSSLK